MLLGLRTMAASSTWIPRNKQWSSTTKRSQSATDFMIFLMSCSGFKLHTRSSTIEYDNTAYHSQLRPLSQYCFNPWKGACMPKHMVLKLLTVSRLFHSRFKPADPRWRFLFEYTPSYDCVARNPSPKEATDACPNWTLLHAPAAHFIYSFA
jgi:hypothetical protein